MEGTDGAFYSIGEYGSYFDSVATNNGLNNAIQFNASLYSTIYGSSYTVQPSAITMQYIIKY